MNFQAASPTANELKYARNMQTREPGLSRDVRICHHPSEISISNPIKTAPFQHFWLFPLHPTSPASFTPPPPPIFQSAHPAAFHSNPPRWQHQFHPQRWRCESPGVTVASDSVHGLRLTMWQTDGAGICVPYPRQHPYTLVLLLAPSPLTLIFLPPSSN